MRLLYVIHSFPPESRGGSEIACQRVAVDMARAGHEVHVFTRIGDDNIEEGVVSVGEENGVSVHRINRTYRTPASFSQTYASTMVEGVFTELIKRLQPDLVHFHHLTHLSLGLPTIAKSHGQPIVFTLHDFWLFCQRGQLFTKKLTRCTGPSPRKCLQCFDDVLVQAPNPDGSAKRRGLETAARYVRGWLQMRERLRAGRRQWNCVDLFLSSSDYLRGWFISLGMPEHQIVTLDNSYNLQQYDAVPSVQSNGRITFGYIGNLIPTKGVHVLVDAFLKVKGDALLEVHGAYTAYHGGFEDYEDRLRASALDDHRISFKGAYEPEQAADIMARLDVVIVPSIWYENSPLTIHEAFMAKRAVITSAMGGMSELVTHGQNGLLFEPEEPVDLAKQIQRMVDDPSLVETLAVGGPVLSIPDLTRELEETYGRLVSGNGRGN